MFAFSHATRIRQKLFKSLCKDEFPTYALLNIYYCCGGLSLQIGNILQNKGISVFVP